MATKKAVIKEEAEIVEPQVKEEVNLKVEEENKVESFPQKVKEPVIEQKSASSKTFDEFVIKEIMHQKGVDRNKAIEILSNPSK